MKAALYGTEWANPELVAFGRGLEVVGHRAVWRNPHYWRDGEAERFDLVVLSGLHAKHPDILRVYGAQGVPVLVLDAGYMRRDLGYWQASLGGLNRAPSFPCESDRFDALGITIKTAGGNPKGYRLIAGQLARDASHGLAADEYETWLHGQKGRLRRHPLETVVPPLADDLAGAKCVHTYCSTAGLDALIAGVPATADAPERACWGELSGAKLPSIAARRALCNRLAYGQWTLDEMEYGVAPAFIVENVWRW
jgi:hypothetical protein